MLCMAIERFMKSGRESGLSPLPREGAHGSGGPRLRGELGGDNFHRCFQLMECADLRLLEQWADRWRDLVDFAFVPVPRSKEAAELISEIGRASCRERV